MTGIVVDVDNFVRAESDRMFAALVARTGGVNRWNHRRAPAAVDEQDVIRMNRDTLYSSAVIDLASPAVITVPATGDRYLSVMVIDQDHYVQRVLHEAGDHVLDPADFHTRYVAVAARILVDADDPGDVAAANALQDAPAWAPARQNRPSRRTTTRRASPRCARRPRARACQRWRRPE